MTKPPVRWLPAATPRVETGPTQFGDDWPGVFIRGDNAAYYEILARTAAKDEKLDPLTQMALDTLAELLGSSNLMHAYEAQEAARDEPQPEHCDCSGFHTGACTDDGRREVRGTEDHHPEEVRGAAPADRTTDEDGS